MLDKESLLTIERPQPVCSECNAPLDDLERHPTGLRFAQEDHRRRDFCPDCWQFAKADAYDSYWITKRVKKEKAAPKLSRREKAVAARALFEKLWEEREREDVDVHLYFLSHLLLRWGGLRWKRSDTDAQGRELIVFENPVTGDLIEIRSVEASEQEILAVKERIEAFLRDYAPDEEAAIE